MANGVRIDADRLWHSLKEMAQIGSTAKGGVRRLALTDVDKEARDLFISWCRDAGCGVRIDRLGNIFARREGADSTRPAVAIGSHLDTQPTDGRFDGAYGVLAGLEVLRALNDCARQTRAAIEVVVWANEEGSRFAPAMVASGAFAGYSTRSTRSRGPTSQARLSGKSWRSVAIRGILSTGNAPTTQFHIDETPLGIRQIQAAGASGSPMPQIFDLDRVEVLRGPQGTLFGASSMGGAIRKLGRA